MNFKVFKAVCSAAMWSRLNESLFPPKAELLLLSWRRRCCRELDRITPPLVALFWLKGIAFLCMVSKETIPFTLSRLFSEWAILYSLGLGQLEHFWNELRRPFCLAYLGWVVSHSKQDISGWSCEHSSSDSSPLERHGLFNFVSAPAGALAQLSHRDPDKRADNGGGKGLGGWSVEIVSKLGRCLILLRLAKMCMPNVAVVCWCWVAPWVLALSSTILIDDIQGNSAFILYPVFKGLCSFYERWLLA